MSWAEEQDWFGLDDFIEDHHPEFCFGCKAVPVVDKNNIPYIDDEPCWEMADHELIAVKDMDTSHIKNCIRKIYRSNGRWRHQYLRIFESELRNRRMCSQSSTSYSPKRTKEMYQVVDTTGAVLRTYPTWKQAETYRCITGRHDWTIRKTDRPVFNPC